MRNFCLDPMKKHKKQINIWLRTISESLFDAYKGKLNQSTLLCNNCHFQIARNPGLIFEDNDSTNSEGSNENEELTYESFSEEMSELEMGSNVTSVLKELDVTPIKKRKYILF